MEKDRDNFSPSVKLTLAGRAGWICSFPRCNRSTAGPAQESPDKSIKNGIAAHITAAAPGGPRYDSLMSPEQRSDISNGIWMCPTHGNLIDKEDSAYTVEEIKNWKIEAENRATRNLEFGQPTYPHSTGSRYSEKDTRILADYSNVMSYSTIQIIKDESFGSFVKDEITNPLYAILQMDGDPRFKFQDYELEKLRQTLNSQIKAFFWHFGQQSAGGSGGYHYVDIYQFTRNEPGSRPYWENYIKKTQDLADELCSTAMLLLEIKEDN